MKTIKLRKTAMSKYKPYYGNEFDWDEKYHFDDFWNFNLIVSVKKYLYETFHGKPNLNFLEIGCYQGMTTIWILENILTHETSKIHCVDLFSNDDYSELYPNSHLGKNVHQKNYEQHFLKNIELSELSHKVTIHKGPSYRELKSEELKENSFDAILIDGSHTAYDTLLDAAMSHHLLKSGGFMFFDDYHWKPDEFHWGTDTRPQTSPELGINSFVENFGIFYDVLEKDDTLPIVTLKKL